MDRWETLEKMLLNHPAYKEGRAMTVEEEKEYAEYLKRNMPLMPVSTDLYGEDNG